MTAINYFELFNDFPIVKSSSKRDCFVKFDEKSNIEIMENEKIKKLFLEKNIKTIFWDIDEFFFENIKIIEKIDYLSIIRNIVFTQKKQIQALYIKKPNIS